MWLHCLVFFSVMKFSAQNYSFALNYLITEYIIYNISYILPRPVKLKPI